MAFRSPLIRRRCLLSLLVAWSSILVQCQTAAATARAMTSNWEAGPFPPSATDPKTTTDPCEDDSVFLPSSSNNSNKHTDPPSTTSSPCTQQHHNQGLRHEHDDHGCSLHYSPKPSVIAVITVISFFWVVGTCCISICLSMRLVVPAGDDDDWGFYMSGDDEQEGEEGTVALTVDYRDDDGHDDDDQEQATTILNDQVPQKPNEQESTAPTVDFDVTSDSEVSSS